MIIAIDPLILLAKASPKRFLSYQSTKFIVSVFPHGIFNRFRIAIVSPIVRVLEVYLRRDGNPIIILLLTSPSRHRCQRQLVVVGYAFWARTNTRSPLPIPSWVTRITPSSISASWIGRGENGKGERRSNGLIVLIGGEGVETRLGIGEGEERSTVGSRLCDGDAIGTGHFGISGRNSEGDWAIGKVYLSEGEGDGFFGIEACFREGESDSGRRVEGSKRESGFSRSLGSGSGIDDSRGRGDWGTSTTRDITRDSVPVLLDQTIYLDDGEGEGEVHDEPGSEDDRESDEGGSKTMLGGLHHLIISCGDDVEDAHRYDHRNGDGGHDGTHPVNDAFDSDDEVAEGAGSLFVDGGSWVICVPSTGDEGSFSGSGGKGEEGG